MTKRWQIWVTSILGIWLLASPWVLGYTALTDAAWEAYLLGPAFTVTAVLALLRPRVWQGWVGVTLGIWLLLSPWLLAFSSFEFPTWNMVGVGMVVAVVDGWTID
jgi:hypothetical protein